MPRPRKKRKPSPHHDGEEIPDHVLVQTRISREAKDKIEKLAALEGLSIASWLRRLVIVTLRAEADPLLKQV
jgi:hypothetical protein